MQFSDILGLIQELEFLSNELKVLNFKCTRTYFMLSNSDLTGRDVKRLISAYLLLFL
jgi:hypothetical protein